MLRNRLQLGLAAALVATLSLIAAAPAAAQPACGETITTNTTLTADLDCHGVQALFIGADDVTLNLAGHSIYSSAPAVVATGHHGLLIRNGKITSGTAALILSQVTFSTVRDLDMPTWTTGIRLDNSDGNRILNNHMPNTRIQLANGSDLNLLRGNVTSGHEGGILLGDSSYNKIVDNISWTGDNPALYLATSDHNVVRHNTLLAGQGGEVTLVGSDDNTFTSNWLVEYGNYRAPAAFLDSSSRNVWRRNRFSEAPLGFHVASGADNVFASNRLEGAFVPTFQLDLADGVRVGTAASGTVVRNNTISGFGNDGIHAEGSQTLIKGNSADDNGDFGIFASGAIDGGGNTASGNGNPAQCSGVVCN